MTDRHAEYRERIAANAHRRNFEELVSEVPPDAADLLCSMRHLTGLMHEPRIPYPREWNSRHVLGRHHGPDGRLWHFRWFDNPEDLLITAATELPDGDGVLWAARDCGAFATTFSDVLKLARMLYSTKEMDDAQGHVFVEFWRFEYTDRDQAVTFDERVDDGLGPPNFEPWSGIGPPPHRDWYELEWCDPNLGSESA